MRYRMLALAMMVGLGCGKDTTGTGSNDGADPLPSDSKPVATLAALTLWEEFGTNSVAAEQKYLGKVVAINGAGKVTKADDGRNCYGFVLAMMIPMTDVQIASMPKREQAWFQAGGYPPNVICYLSRDSGEAATVKPGTPVTVTGVVKGMRKADVWKDYVVELERCTVRASKK